MEVGAEAVAAAAASTLRLDEHVRERQRAVLSRLTTLGYLPPQAAAGRSGCFVHAGGFACDALGRRVLALSLTSSELDASYGEAGCAINIGEGVPLSCEHERRAGAVLAALCDELLRGMPTSLAQDEDELAAAATAALAADEAASPPSPSPAGSEGRAERRRLVCVRARLSRKRILAECRARADEWTGERCTATASFRRPWRINIKTSG